MSTQVRNHHDVHVLGLESSCDETAAAILSWSPADGAQIRSNVVASQHDAHAAYGGVVPEIAARAHAERMDAMIDAAFEQAAVSRDDIGLVAATSGPGLLGGVLVGLLSGEACALAMGAPFVAVNHLAAHALTARLTHDLSFPYLVLLASGGHCQLVSVLGVESYRRLGATLDDALGEAFDKTAKLMGLPFPGGPAIERAAKSGVPTRFPLPRPLAGRSGCDFSFAGLKTAVRTELEALPQVTEQDVADMAASFQHAAVTVTVDRTRGAMAAHARATGEAGRILVASGGVAANAALRSALESLAAQEGWRFVAPPPALCTDNAAMIAWAGLERWRLGATDALGVAPRARWPLDADPAPAASAAGWGMKGAKA